MMMMMMMMMMPMYRMTQSREQRHLRRQCLNKLLSTIHS